MSGAAGQDRPRSPLADAAPRLLRTAEVAGILGMSRRAVISNALAGKLPSLLTPGGHRRYPEDEIRQLAARLAEPDPAPPAAKRARYAAAGRKGGAKGGQATRDRHGADHDRRIGAKGGRAAARRRRGGAAR